MDYKIKNGKYIIQKDGVYFSILPDQVTKLLDIVMKITLSEADRIITEKLKKEGISGL